MTTTPLLQPADLEVPLTIRFSASIPDILLDVPSPATTTAAGLKQLIRTRLPRDLAAHRLRLIYSGRALEDAVPLATSLRLPPQYHQHSRGPSPTPSSWPEDDDENDGNGKGKAPVRDPPMRRLYIHCSVGDIVLSKTELDKEAKLASTISQQEQQQQQHGAEWNDIPLSTSQEEQQQRQQARRQQQEQEEATTTPAPRGFDRLLLAGFTPAEVSALRSQFLALQSVSHTPDTMPSGSELRELEDRWMDEGTGAVPAGVAGGVGGGGGTFGDDDGGFGTGSRGALDDMLWGAVMGFFWPVGCAMWLRREEGVWSWRKGLAVFVGVVINGAFGAMMIMN
ncbi:hypothetical protein Plec18167_002737 [Paecilomyces lecythidis]|uniref:Ubiquitin-like domain-containing protein n=1 Tax=Paecilomyces lecythidis TaxID=3004212 RepID=A0ABR3Y7N7_9EURO